MKRRGKRKLGMRVDSSIRPHLRRQTPQQSQSSSNLAAGASRGVRGPAADTQRGFPERKPPHRGTAASRLAVTGRRRPRPRCCTSARLVIARRGDGAQRPLERQYDFHQHLPHGISSWLLTPSVDSLLQNLAHNAVLHDDGVDALEDADIAEREIHSACAVCTISSLSAPLSAYTVADCWSL